MNDLGTSFHHFLFLPGLSLSCLSGPFQPFGEWADGQTDRRTDGQSDGRNEILYIRMFLKREKHAME